MWRDSGTLKIDNTAHKTSSFQIVCKGILINILNPKLTIFFFAFLPLFISPDQTSPTQQMVGLSVVFMGMTFVIFALYGILASWISIYIMNSPKIMRGLHRSFAVIFAALAVKLALSKQ